MVDGQELTLEAFAALNVRAVSAGDQSGDLIIDLDGTRLVVEVKRWSSVTEDVARKVLRRGVRTRGAAILVVGDRITEDARELLLALGSGYYDLRGRLALRSAGVLIDVSVDAFHARSARIDPLSGAAGLEVATALLMDPNRQPGVRELARELNRSPSTVSEVLSLLRENDLAGANNAIRDPQLFWRVADRWPTARTYLKEQPRRDVHSASTTQPLRLGLDEIDRTPGWALTDSAAAATYGAPIAYRPGQLLEFFVPDKVVLRRAITLLGEASSPAQSQCTVRVGPVPVICKQRVSRRQPGPHWPLAHPLFVALDLAQDVGRGREILDAWAPEPPWTRVW